MILQAANVNIEAITDHKKIKEYEQIDKNNTDMENKAKKIIEKNIRSLETELIEPAIF